MKKFLEILTAGSMAFILAACGNTASAGTSAQSQSAEASVKSGASSGSGTTGAASGTASAGSAAASATASAASSGDVTGSMKGVTIKAGTSGLFGPFSYYDTDGTTLIGYDLDMIKDLQDILGFEIDGGVQAMDYSALTASVAEGKLDVAAAALCATDERKKVMSFSDTYCDSGQMVMINKDNDEGITGVEDLAGKTVAVEKGTASHMYAQKNLTSSKIEVHDTITTAYESLEQKKVDAVIQDGPGCAFYIKTTEGTKLETVGDEFNQGQAPYAIAYNNDFAYKDQFNAALKMLKDNGTLDKLYEKWCK
ncbi:MAG TPA: transporter substrate-binding domain-containing protein [Lachnospiraceae bacterium]|nr:transporter substrate-binding domain-containing protein [Lachnospiraceae bacterium]